MGPARVSPVDNLNWEDKTKIEIDTERKRQEEEKQEEDKKKNKIGFVYLCDVYLYHINSTAESGHFTP